MGRGTVEGIPSPEIMIGMLLGIIMAGNVWFIIWPNQKKIIAGELEGDALAKAKRNAFLASRTNAWLSLPMLDRYDRGQPWRYNGRILTPPFGCPTTPF